MKSIDIGKIVQNRIAEIGMTKAEFGRRMNTSRQNVNTLLRKSDWTTSQLIKASLSLNTNFFQPYLELLGGRLDDLPKAEPLVGQGLSVSLVLREPAEMAALLERLGEMRGG